MRGTGGVAPKQAAKRGDSASAAAASILPPTIQMSETEAKSAACETDVSESDTANTCLRTHCSAHALLCARTARALCAARLWGASGGGRGSGGGARQSL